MNLNLVNEITKDQLRTDIPEFRPGCTVRVDVKIKEGDKSRIQAFEGLVIAKKGSGIAETFTVRKMSSGVGVERTFPLHSPIIDKITVVRRGKVRRSKLFYLLRSVRQSGSYQRNSLVEAGAIRLFLFTALKRRKEELSWKKRNKRRSTGDKSYGIS